MKLTHPLDVRNGWIFTVYVAAIGLAIGLPLAAIILTIVHYVR